MTTEAHGSGGLLQMLLRLCSRQEFHLPCDTQSRSFEEGLLACVSIFALIHTSIKTVYAYQGASMTAGEESEGSVSLPS